MDKAYLDLLEQVKKTIRQERSRAIQQVNRTLIGLYWEIGKQIVESQERHGWGKSVVEQLAQDLQVTFPSQTGFSPRNLWDMRRFFETYKDIQICDSLSQKFPGGII